MKELRYVVALREEVGRSRHRDDDEEADDDCDAVHGRSVGVQLDTEEREVSVPVSHDVIV